MKILKVLIVALLTTAPQFATSETSKTEEMLKIAVVNFKTCVDQSKLGKEEQSQFEALRKQMENALEEKEKIMNEYATKLNDADYLDSLSPEAETDLKRKSRALSQELNQIQGQFYQTLSQTNMRIVQNLQEAVSIAAKAVAKQKNIPVILNEESSFFYDAKYDISQDVIAEMDKNYDKEVEEENKAEDNKS